MLFQWSKESKRIFFYGTTKRNHCSKTLRVKQLNLYGKIPECDKSPYHRRLEKQYNVNFNNLKQRNWIFEGQTIVSPNWIQQSKPYIINRQLRAEYSKPSEQIKDAWKPRQYNLVQKFLRKVFFFLPDINQQQTQTQNSEDQTEANSKEDSQADGLFTDDKDIMFPEEF